MRRSSLPKDLRRRISLAGFPTLFYDNTLQREIERLVKEEQLIYLSSLPRKYLKINKTKLN